MSKPIFKPHPDFKIPVIVPCCPKCGYGNGNLCRFDNHCPQCGEPLEWDGEMPIDDEAVKQHMAEKNITQEDIDRYSAKIHEGGRKYTDA